jgi:hypothetical protein
MNSASEVGTVLRLINDAAGQSTIDERLRRFLTKLRIQITPFRGRIKRKEPPRKGLWRTGWIGSAQPEPVLGNARTSLRESLLGASQHIELNCVLISKKTHAVHGGRGEIRTHGTLRYTRFPSVRIRPLCHPSTLKGNVNLDHVSNDNKEKGWGA